MLSFKNKLEKKMERASRELIEEFISAAADNEARDLRPQTPPYDLLRFEHIEARLQMLRDLHRLLATTRPGYCDN